MMKRTISILEDNHGIREVLEMLFWEDFEVRTFASVREFMDADCGSLPHIFLLDVMLPDGNGLDVCKILKNTPESRAIPVLMMSAHADINEIKKYSMADGFVSKPFDIFHLLATVNNNLSRAVD
ncbi:response regulator transcription factor [Pedobacter sp. 22226]|uniref:response regulator transcription factor n=1 Tax=Pedobacter sp. 22226 TaxID=3453894 RepID=UPI003F837298